MSEKAPVVIAAVDGFNSLTESGQAHYAGLPAGTPLLLVNGPKIVDVNTNCCGVSIGSVSEAEAAILRGWMEKGWMYTASIKNAADLFVFNGVASVRRRMTIRCVPSQQISLGKVTKITKKKKPVLSLVE